MLKARLHFDGDNVGIEKLAREYSLTQDVENKLNSIPEVIDNVTTDSGTDALSARMGMRLQEQIDNLASRGRYLTTWNAETGLPDTNPQVSPYVYRAGDYYIVGNVSSGTNYRPHGSSYTSGVASQTVEPESLSVNDLYIYDGTQWVLQGGGGTHSTVWGSISGTLSNQTDLQNALDEKLNFGDNLAFNDTTTVLVGRGVHSPGGDSCGHWVTIDPKGEVFTHNATTGGYNETTLGNGEIEILHSVSSTSTDYTVTIDHEKLTVNDGINTQIYSFLGSNRIATLNDITAHTIPELHTNNAYYDLINATPGTYKLVDSGKYLGCDNLIPSGIGYVQKPTGGDYTTGGNGILYFKGQYDWTYIEGGTIIRADYRYAQSGTGNDSYEFLRISPMAGWQAPAGAYRGQLWYDTNSGGGLKVYDVNNNWTLVGGGGGTYSAGNGISIDANNEISVDTTVVATQTDIANFFDKTSDDADDIDDTNSTNKFVTDTEKNTWNGKQDAIQDLSTIRSNAAAGAGAATTISGYGDIVTHDANEFATAAQGAKADTALQSGDDVSELVNDAGYITNAVNDLANYYKKTETYTQAEINSLISNFGGFEVVSTLPVSDIKTNIIYLLGPTGTGADKYEEYIYYNSTWTKIGDTSVDLTNYFNTSTQTSDAITQGSTNLFLTSAERTKLNNTSGVNSGDETKSSIQTALGAATSSNSGYLTSTDWATFNGKANASDINTKMFKHIGSNGFSNAEIQEAVDYIITSGKLPILVRDVPNVEYIAYSPTEWVRSGNDRYIKWESAGTNSYEDGCHYLTKNIIQANLNSSNQVTSVNHSSETIGEYLDTDYNYSTPYTPLYDGSPATKKYVDDSIQSAVSSLASFEVVATLPSASSADPHTIYLLGPIGTGADKYEEWIVTDQPVNTTYTGEPVGSGNFDYSPLQLVLSSSTTLTYVSSTGTGARGFCLESAPYYGYFESGIVGQGDGWYEYNGSSWDFVDSTSITVNSGTYRLDCGPADYDFDTIVISTGTEKTWTKIGETSIDLTNYFNTSTQDSDSITEGSTNLFLTSSERNILSDTSGVNTGDQSASDFDIKDLADSTGLRIEWSKKQDALTAGSNIQIAQDGTISATDTTYNAGTGIEIKNGPDYSAMKGPAPDGFHVPLNTEWQAVYNIWAALGGGSRDGTNFGIALKLPFAGSRSRSSADVGSQGISGNYWSSSPNPSKDTNSYRFYFNSSNVDSQSNDRRAYGFSVRCFKNSPTMPTSSWTKLYGTSIEAGGIFWSSTDGLISMSSDGQTWITIADKNLGATQVWNSGDTLSEANCGKYYQWGNNYGFPFIGTIANQSTTQVDASNYGPGNYYSSDTFIKSNGRWDTTDNGNLWGGETGVVTFNNAITNTGVLSVNGQTGDVTIQTGGTYTAGDGIDIDANNEITVDNTIARVTDVNTKTFYLSSASDLTTAQAAYDWYLAGKNSIIVYGNKAYSIMNHLSSSTTFAGLINTNIETGNSYTNINYPEISLRHSNNTVTSIDIGGGGNTDVLRVGYNYPTPYTPQYDGSPATKKYVDDNVVQKSATAPSSPTEGMVWYDTTNDVLKVYDGTNWNEVGGGSGDMLYADFNWASKTGATVTLDLNSTITPSANFTVNAPSTIKDGQMYVLRVTQGATAYTMTLGTNVTNPYGESLTMSAYTVNQFSFLAVGGNLELQPSVTVGESGAKIFYANTGDTGHEISDIGEELETWLNATGQTDDYDTFKDAVLVYDGVTYNRRNTFYSDSGYKYIYFISRNPNVQNNNNGTSKGYYSLVRFKFSYSSGWSYENDYSTSYITTTTQSFLRTDFNYSTPYTPLYNGSPATKKYVDDSIVTYTAGSGISISNQDVVSASIYPSSQTGAASTVKIWVGTQSDYNSLASYDSGTLYFTTSS